MTTTATAPTTVQTATVDPVVPALMHDNGGYFRLVNGKRLPANEPGWAILDGTPAETAYATMISLDKAMVALAAQYRTAEQIVKDTVGDKAVATLHGEKVITWRWSNASRSLDAGLVEAILPPEQWEVVSVISPRRAFTPKFRREH